MKKKSRKPVVRKTASKNNKKAFKKKPRKTTKSVAKPKVKAKAKATPELQESVISGKIPTEITLMEQLFGGVSKAKLWKIFSINPNKEFTLKQLLHLTKLKTDKLIPDLRDLMRQGVIVASRKQIISPDALKNNSVVYQMNEEFPLRRSITELILSAVPRDKDRIVEHVQDLPRLKTVILSGFFINASDYQSPIDMILIFDKIPSQVNETVAELERALGRELKYAALDQEDFKYRHSIGDRLIRDVLDFEHVVAMDKMGFFR